MDSKENGNSPRSFFFSSPFSLSYKFLKFLFNSKLKVTVNTQPTLSDRLTLFDFVPFTLDILKFFKLNLKYLIANQI